MDDKKINISKYKLPNNKLKEYLDNLETKVPKGYITIERAYAKRKKTSSVKDSK